MNGEKRITQDSRIGGGGELWVRTGGGVDRGGMRRPSCYYLYGIEKHASGN